MNQKYLKYNLDELIDDKQFISWVIYGDKGLEWEKFKNRNPEFSAIAEEAREIILLMRVNYEVLDDASVLNMWESIERFDKAHRIRMRTIRNRRSLSWAATLLFLLSMGTLAYYKLVNTDQQYQFVSTEITTQSSETRLLFPDGDEIELNRNNSTIELNSNNELVINSDSVIVLSQKRFEVDQKLQMNEVIIPFGKRSELLLADGTKVWINAGSQLAFPSKFARKNREVYLEGEACFKVANKDDHPFIVHVAEMEITVLGTHFNVSAYADDEAIETVLIEGSVALSNPKTLGIGRNEVLLKPNQKASFNKENSNIQITDEPNANVYITWIDGWFQFSKESLPSVFTKLERYYNVEFILPHDFQSPELISGKLDLKESIEDVLIALCGLERIEYRIDGSEISINRSLKE